jgi:hypothetical protein
LPWTLETEELAELGKERVLLHGVVLIYTKIWCSREFVAVPCHYNNATTERDVNITTAKEGCELRCEQKSLKLSDTK